MSRAADERLARRAQRGDERAFAAIFERYHQRLYRYCLGILANPEDAQDALQSTMVKALRALPGEARSINLKPWLYRIAHNESIDLLRRRRVTEPTDPGSLPERTAVAEKAQVGVAERIELRERLGTLLSDLRELPDRQRGALLMRELSDLSFEEIAASFETTPGVARQTVYEARLSLRQMGEGREMSCEEVMRAVSDGDRRVLRRKDIRAHLRACGDCAAFEAEIANRNEDLAALAPIPALAAAGILGGILGGGGAGGGAAAAGGVAAGGLGSGAAAATVASSTALKVAATAAVVAALGTAAADRGGLIHVVGGGGQPVPSGKSTQTGTSGPSTQAVSGAGRQGPGHARAQPSGRARGERRDEGKPWRAGLRIGAARLVSARQLDRPWELPLRGQRRLPRRQWKRGPRLGGLQGAPRTSGDPVPSRPPRTAETAPPLSSGGAGRRQRPRANAASGS